MSPFLNDLHVVTGAFGYTGKYIARRLLALGRRVRTLTAHPERPNPFGQQVEIARLDFDDPDELARQLEGVSVLYNTYWVRFAHDSVSFDEAMQNSHALFDAARRAGVPRIVHISVTNPSLASALPYFHGKAVVEHLLQRSGLSYAIVRPTVIFGREDILINNIAWLLRRFPVFAVAGAGDYRLQPVYVEDVAEIAVAAAGRTDNVILEAAGPEVFTFDDLVRLIREKVESRARILHLSPGTTRFAAKLVSSLVRDVLLTCDELDGLMAGLLVSSNGALGRTRFGAWLEQNAAVLGTHYASELDRHYR